jgi:hypothetical protein
MLLDTLTSENHATVCTGKVNTAISMDNPSNDPFLYYRHQRPRETLLYHDFTEMHAI